MKIKKGKAMDLVLKKNPCCETKRKTFKASIFWRVSGHHAQAG